jgi:hypothetical protein
MKNLVTDWGELDQVLPCKVQIFGPFRMYKNISLTQK